jgi:hypothetical protein
VDYGARAGGYDVRATASKALHTHRLLISFIKVFIYFSLRNALNEIFGRTKVKISYAI